VTPTGEIRKGQMVTTYLCRKLAERWTGDVLPATYGGGGLEQGTLRQNEAIDWYAQHYEQPVSAVGFITTDDGRIGCSPDGLLADGTGIEAKCPDLHTHVRYLLCGGLPPEYWAQVQGSMLVTGAARWIFISYCRRFPPLVLTVQRDEAGIAALRAALDAFLGRLDEGFRRLVELNGGAAPDTGDDDYALGIL
jgi:hypothetical protein